MIVIVSGAWDEVVESPAPLNPIEENIPLSAAKKSRKSHRRTTMAAQDQENVRPRVSITSDAHHNRVSCELYFF